VPTPPDHVFTLAEVSTFTVDGNECMAFIRVPRPQRANEGRPGMGTIIRLQDVLVHLCKMTAARARSQPREYALSFLGHKLQLDREDAELALSSVSVLVTGLSPKPMHFIFSEVVSVLQLCVHKNDLKVAASHHLNISRLVATLEVHGDGDDDVDTNGNATAAGRRIASWFLSLNAAARARSRAARTLY